MGNEFHSNKEFPSELNYAKTRFSVDVLVWDEQRKEHTVAWYDFNLMKWWFLCREVHGEFEWRYFIEGIDKPKK